MIRKLWARSREFVIYCVIGGSGVALDCVVFATLIYGCDWHYQLANALSVSCGICNNFFWNAFFNFKRTNHLILRFLSFYSVGLIGLGISAGLLWLLIEVLAWNTFFAKIAIIFVVTLVQFTLNKLITFHQGVAK